MKRNLCPACKNELPAGGEFCPHCENAMAGSAGFLGMPRAFWLILVGAAGVVLFAQPYWLRLTLPLVGTESLTLPRLFGRLDGFAFLLTAQDVQTIKVLLVALFAVWVLSLALLLVSLVLYKSNLRALFAGLGFGLAVVMPVAFMIAVAVINRDIQNSLQWLRVDDMLKLTISPFLMLLNAAIATALVIYQSRQQIAARNPKRLIKYVPNALSVMRVFLSVAMLFLTGENERWLFVAVYIVIGLSDVFDGKIARRYNVESNLGSKLDAVGDSMLFGAAFIAMVFLADLKINTAACLLTMSFAIIYKLANVAVTRLRFGEWNMMHTLANKAVFVTLYFYVPAFMLLREINYWMILGITVAICLACLEETVTLFKLKEYDVNHHGVVGQKLFKK